MRVTDSRAHRRVLVRVDGGEDLVEALAELAGREAAGVVWVRGVGALSRVELTTRAARGPDAVEVREVPCDLLALEGVLTPGARELYATVTLRTPSGLEVLGGRLLAAGAERVDLVLECHDLLERDDVTRRDDAGEPVRAAEGAGAARAWVSAARAPDVAASARELAAPAAGGVSWADVAALSAAPELAAPPPSRPSRSAAAPPADHHRPPPLPERRRLREDEVEHTVLPEKGDFVHHSQFGVCKVDKSDGRDGIAIRLPSGVRKNLRLDYLDVGAPRFEGQKRIFPIRPRR